MVCVLSITWFLASYHNSVALIRKILSLTSTFEQKLKKLRKRKKTKPCNFLYKLLQTLYLTDLKTVDFYSNKQSDFCRTTQCRRVY